MSLYDPSRVDKIGTIMTSFTGVAKPGDRVLMGLEGDPMFPQHWQKDRPTGVVYSNDGNQVVIDMDGGGRETYEAGMLNPKKVWEFSDDAFDKVIKRETDSYRGVATPAAAPQDPSPVPQPDYRGIIDTLERDLKRLNEKISSFHTVYLTSLRELARDVTDGNCKFCKAYGEEFDSMNYRGVSEGADDVDEATDVDEVAIPPSVESKVDATLHELSASESDFW